MNDDLLGHINHYRSDLASKSNSRLFNKAADKLESQIEIELDIYKVPRIQI